MINTTARSLFTSILPHQQTTAAIAAATANLFPKYFPAVSSLAAHKRYKRFSPPSSATVTATDLSAASDIAHTSRIDASLKQIGLAIVNLNFPDPDSKYLVQLIRDGLCQQHKHTPPIDHSLTHGWLWDVKPVSTPPQQEKKDGKTTVRRTTRSLARSETMQTFPWHTDCSFDPCPPRYFALHVLHADRFGGGNLSLLPVDSLLNKLSPSTISTLQLPLFNLRVPAEFNKGVEGHVGTLLDISRGCNKLRYRHDITIPLDTRAQKSLEELETVLEEYDEELRVVVKTDVMRDGAVIILDNARWLHARSSICDPRRHLRRVRWGAERF